MKHALQLERATFHRWSPLVTPELSITLHTPNMEDSEIDETMPILRRLKQDEYVNALIYPYSESTVTGVQSVNPEPKHGNLTASQITRLKIKALWEAKGCPGDSEEYYQNMQKRIQNWIDKLIQESDHD